MTIIFELIQMDMKRTLKEKENQELSTTDTLEYHLYSRTICFHESTIDCMLFSNAFVVVSELLSVMDRLFFIGFMSELVIRRKRERKRHKLET